MTANVDPIKADLHGRVAIVTGANTGIGKQAAQELARLGARVVLACRNEQRGRAAVNEITAKTGSDAVELLTVDLSSQPSIRAFARALLARHPVLHILVNNAGVWPDDRTLTVDGIETTWATNVLGYFLLTELLLDALKKGAPSRIVNVASNLARGLDLDDVQFEKRRFGGRAAYAQSKQANRIWTWELARRLEGTRVTANAMHPGMVATELLRNMPGVVGAVGRVYFALAGRTVEQGADTIVWLGASPDVDGISGRFWKDRAEHPCRYRDPRELGALWSLCESMIR